jgi:erythromycin esterase
MAENTMWILEAEPPGTKMMLWAHNFHISLSPYPGYPFIFMGMHLRRVLGNDYLAIGFVFNRGSFQGLDFTSPNREHIVMKSFTVGPYPGSYGLAMSRTRLPYFFLDLHQVPASGVVHDWFSVPQVCKWVNYIYDSEKDIKYLFQLPRLFDAVVFIDKTTRARPLPSGRRPAFPY